MEDLSIQGFKRCPECGADNPPPAASCWLCGAALDRGAKSPGRAEPPADAGLVNPYQSTVPPPVTGEPYQFRLITLVLIVTVICLGLGLWRIAPGLTILLLIIVVPALVRASVASRRSAAPGRRPGLGDVLIAFAMSFALVILTIVAGFVAFCIACFAALIGFGERSIELIVITAVLGGIAVIVALTIATWPRRKRD